MVSRPAAVTGEVWHADLGPTVGSEIQKTRPCVVLSPLEMHDYLRTVIVAPMTTGSARSVQRQMRVSAMNVSVPAKRVCLGLKPIYCVGKNSAANVIRYIFYSC